jgi:hypothetical protein
MTGQPALLFVLSSLLLVLFFSPAEALSGSPAIDVVQGGFFLVSEPVSAKGRHIMFLNRTIPFERLQKPGKGPFRGLAAGSRLLVVGIDLAQKPGVYPLKVMETGRLATVRVVPRKFMVSRLHVRSRFVSPPPTLLARILRERHIIHEALSRRSPLLVSGAFILPLKGRVTHDFGAIRILNGKPMSRHLGEDIDAPEGTPVLAANDGKVVLAGRFYYDGNMVIVDHGGGLFTEYLHLHDIQVHPGESVRCGDLIGHLGHTGRVTGPVFHYGAVLEGSHVNPMLLSDRNWISLPFSGR